jgi:5-methylcytosine-specific restriction endonuclease McrA
MYGNACVKCGDKATDVDHVIELDAGGEDSIENLQPLCNPCHKVKTSAYNSKRLKKPESNGFFYKALPPTTLSLSYLSPRLTVEPPISQKKEKSPNDA